jgi:hypothetical protein
MVVWAADDETVWLGDSGVWLAGYAGGLPVSVGAVHHREPRGDAGFAGRGELSWRLFWGADDRGGR